ncbi:TRAP transporter large permease [Pseudogracilibacillus sp. SO30301A]|uniref:TRAP transporter large permease n=1 Tax=Pseudogracilibacillus sp. SO30301A TaxID=3098291 RepID=UPI00300DE3DB
MVTILFIAFFLLLFLSVPVAVALGGSSFLALLLESYSLTTIPQKVFEGLSGFTLLAIPFFILAGNLMSSGGIAKRIINFASVLVKWVTGGVGVTTILTTTIFSTISGSSSATTAAIGSIMIPNMEKRGYARNFAAALSAAAGEMGAIIPPSIVIIMYAMASGTSIGDMFLATIIPGILVGVFLIIGNYLYVRSAGIDRREEIKSRKNWFKDILIAFKESILALLLPVLIFGGIYLGLFSPTEVAVLAVIYSFILGVFVYKEIKLRDVHKVFIKSAMSTAIIMVIVGFASIFAYVLTINQIPHQIAQFLLNVTENPIIFLLLLNLLLLFLGMFLEAFSAIIILTPILLPAALSFGIDPIHFGVILILNLACGMITPPVGVNLFIVSEIAKVPFAKLIRPALFLVTLLLINVLLITYIPDLSTWLPSLTR